MRRILELVVLPIALGYGVGFLAVGGCGASFAEIDQAAKDGDTDAQIRVCSAKAREAYHVMRKTDRESLAIYDACIKDGGK